MAKIDPGPGYRLLKVGEVKPECYEVWYQGAWHPGDHPEEVVKDRHAFMRVKLPETLAQALDAGIQETVQDAEERIAEGSGAPKPGDTAPNGLTIPGPPPGFAMVPRSRARKDPGCLYLGDLGKWREPATVKGAYRHDTDVYCSPAPPKTGSMVKESKESGLDLGARLPKAPSVSKFLDQWVPKPFTPNKYTRDLLSLDGRRVPVDVYSVLAAFPSNNGAVDHTLKKLLAPGQRGHKDRLQDLKEARASLDRAIQMEEG